MSEPRPSEPEGTSLARRAALVGILGSTVALTGCTRRGDGASTHPTTVPPEPSVDPARDPDLHLLRRLTFGPTRSDLAELRARGEDAWLDAQLEPDLLDTTAVEELVRTAFPPLDATAADLLAQYREDPNLRELGTALPGATLVRHLHSPAQLFERMVEFWGDHFNVPQVGPAATIARLEMDRDVVRPHALGRFDELLVAIAQSPAMLRYLDNFRSVAGSINENYARELLELHTLGVNGGYTEDDIVETARLLTGWTIDRSLRFRFAPARHDHGPVSVLGWTRPSTGDPRVHGEDFLRHLARRPETARHVSARLARRFVADDPPADLVEKMAATWTEHDTAIVPVLRVMIDHSAFRDAPAKFNRPWDHLVQTLRALDTDIDASFAPNIREAAALIRTMGQVPFRWPTPDGYPDDAASWSSAGGLLARWTLALRVVDPADRSFRTSLPELVEAHRGGTAGDLYRSLSTALRHEDLDQRVLDALAIVTEWDPDDVPPDDEVDATAPLVAAVLLSTPSAHYR